LWTYNPQTNKWTWMTGSSSVGSPQGLTGGPAGVYGTEGQMAVGNTPGGRDGAFAWADGGGNLWLFGGYGHDATDANGELNDLWEFTP
jgi:N-acetylneuraminic acid mutarotase